MNGIVVILNCALSLMFGSCNSDKDTIPKTSSLNAPVETNVPNSNYKPAFKGQTRISGVTTKTKYGFKVITSSLKNPWGITPLPDGRFLVTEKGGQMRIVTIKGEIGKPIAGIPKVNSSGQGGLLGLCLDPDFVKSRMVYWSFSEPGSDGNVTAVAKGRLSDDERTMEGVAVIYRALPAHDGNNHYGSRVIFDNKGNLFVSAGERFDLTTRPQAQWVNSALGKIIRITKEGQPAPGNPFAKQANARPEVYTLGHRNPQGLAINPKTGDLWEIEFGPRGGDELNLIRPGANYGWPTITYGIEYSGEKVGAGIQQKAGMEQPVYYWDPVISPSGMTFYNGDRMPEWRNNLFIGCLSGMHIDRLVIENNRVVGEERLLTDEYQRFRDITQGKDGALYAITDQGRLYQLDKK